METKLKRYVPTVLKEMAYKQYDFEQKVLTVYMVNFYEDLVKLKLCDKLFSDVFDKKLYVHAKPYESDWKKQGISLCKTLFNKMRTKKIDKPGNMQKAFISVLENMDTEMIQRNHGVYNAISRATSDFKNKDIVLKKVEDWIKLSDLDTMSWFTSIAEFLIRLIPDHNIIPDEKIVEKEVTKFINNFLRKDV